jgi:rSAM/selenodomain-associated transferase 2
LTDEPRISVLIPALDEEAAIAATVANVRDAVRPVDLTVVDGGSRDGTAVTARAAGAAVAGNGANRGQALNRAAVDTAGDVLLIVHADTALPAGAGDAIRAAMRSADWGAFRIRFEPRLGVVERLVLWRCRLWKAPYGDQAMFVRRNAFDAVGGFPPIPLMDDYELSRRLRRRFRFTLLDLPVTASARRYQRDGVLRTTLRLRLLFLLYRLGVPPDRLLRSYPPARRAA